MKIYLVGSLRNPLIPAIASELRDEGHEVFDDWYAAGPEADDYWQKYEKGRGRSYAEALDGFAAEHVFQFDRYHLNQAQAVVLVLPAGKSGHLEFGYCVGQGKPGFILLDKEPERYDVMYRFAKQHGGGVFNTVGQIATAIHKLEAPEYHGIAERTYNTPHGTVRFSNASEAYVRRDEPPLST